jgi:hypothetical protein
MCRLSQTGRMQRKDASHWRPRSPAILSGEPNTRGAVGILVVRRRRTNLQPKRIILKKPKGPDRQAEPLNAAETVLTTENSGKGFYNVRSPNYQDPPILSVSSPALSSRIANSLDHRPAPPLAWSKQ